MQNNFQSLGEDVSQKRTKRQKKKRRDRRQDLQKALKRRFEKKFPNRKVVTGPTSDGIKMSDVLEDFVEPYMQFAETKEAYQKLLTTAVVAWNVMLFPEEERSSMLDELLGTLPEDVRNVGRQSIEELMVRKERFFSQYRRMIIDFEVRDTGNKWRLAVISLADPE